MAEVIPKEIKPLLSPSDYRVVRVLLQIKLSK